MVTSVGIMIVEDEAIVALEIEERLKKYGYEIVESVSTGEKSLEVLSRLKPALVLMDIRLKGSMNGIEAARQIIDEFSIPVIFITAYADEKTLEQAGAASPYGYLLKPLRGEELHASIQVALHKFQNDQIVMTSEEHFRLFFENLPFYCYVVSIEGGILDINALALNTLGYSKEDLKGRSIDIIYPVDIGIGIKERLRAILDGQNIENEEIDIITGEGTKLTVLESANVARFPSGRLSYVLITQRDITERRMTEERLCRSEERYAELFHRTKDAILIRDLEGNMLDVNRSAIDLFGFSRSEFLDTRITNIASRELVQHVEEEIGEKGWCRIEAPLTKKSGESFIADITSNLIEFGEERIVQTIIDDVTERKQAEEILRKSEQKYRNLIENSVQGVAIYQNRSIVYSNNAFAEILGYTVDEILTLTEDEMRDIIHPHDQEQFLNRIRKMLESDRSSFHYDYRAYHKDGSLRWVECSLSRIEYKGDKAIQIVQMDNTSRKIAEKKVKEERDRAELFLDLMGHDLSNIHQAVYGFLDLLLSKKGLSESTSDLLREALGQLNRGARLISNVRKIKRIEEFSAQLKPVDVSEALSEAAIKVQDDIPHKQLNITVENELAGVSIMADEYLTDVFYELLHNTLRFDRNQYVDVGLRVDPANVNQMVRIQLVDRGTGISDKEKERLFMRSSATKTNHRGTGLGLTLVKHIINRYAGDIHVEDRVRGNYKEGAVFVLEIPRAPPPEPE